MKKAIISLFVIGTAFVGCLSEPTNTETTVEQIETLPLREVKELNYFIEQIKANPEWLSEVEGKAKQQSIPLDSMFIIDATYLQAQDIEIVKIENEIINSPEWLDLVKKKAEEQGLSLDEMIRADAAYNFQQKTISGN